MKRKWQIVLVLLALLLNSGTGLALAGPANTRPAAPAAALAPYTVRIALPASEGRIDPAYIDMPLITDQLFSGLTRIDPVTDLPIGDLAASWAISLDKKQYTFTLRSGLKWSNGTPLTATDVRNTILRNLNPATDTVYVDMLYIIKNAQEYHDGTITNPALVGVSVLSPTQVKFTLREPAAHFPAILAMHLARPTPKSVIDTWGDAWTEPEHIVTSGPYRLKEWVHYDHFLLDKSTNFYDAAKVKIQHVLAVELDETTAFNTFLSGGLDTVTVPWSELAAVKADPALSPLLHGKQDGCTYYYGFSVSQPPFDKLLVRKAFIAAINRQGLIDTVLYGGHQVAQTFTSPGIFGYVDGVAEDVGIPYNPAQAQLWLEDAGYPGGADLPPVTLWFNENTGHQAIAEYIKQNWIDNLGVTVSLQTLPWTDYLTQVRNGAFQIWRLGWCLDYRDAYDYLYQAVAINMDGYYGGWSNPTYTSLLDQAALSTDNAARILHYKQAEEILVETDAVMLPLYFYSTPILTRAYLQRPYTIDTQIRDWALITKTSASDSSGAQDGWVLESSETSNLGGTINAGATTFFLGDNALDRQYRSVLSFNTGGLPDNAVITSVTLKIMSAGPPIGTNPFSTHGNILVDVRKGAFSGSTALQSLDFQASASKLAAITIKNVPVSGWYSGAMASASFGTINKTGITQFRLRFTLDDNDDLGADYLKFYSGNFLTAGSRPKLIIKYYAP